MNRIGAMRFMQQAKLPFGILLAPLEALFLLSATLAFLGFTLPNLANYPGVTDDEIWILSASHKLANDHVFGTDLFKGFWRAEEIYLFNMPLHHFVLAAVFKVFGTSIFIARAVSVVYGVATILLVYAFAREMRGVAVAALSVVLLLTLRLNLAFDSGLPLQEMARSIRYDLAPVPFMLAASLLLLKPTLLRCAAAGLVLGLATLMQFYAAFMFPVVALYFLFDQGRLEERLQRLAVVAVTVFVVMLPYGAVVLANYEEFDGQTSTLYQRLSFDDPEFYYQNLKREVLRFRLHYDGPSDLQHKPSQRLALFVALPASLAYLGWRLQTFNQRGDRILFLSLGLLPLQLLLLDFQKVTFYWVAVVPYLAVAIAVTSGALLAFARRHLRRPSTPGGPPLLAGVLASLVLFIFVTEGSMSQVNRLRDMDATDYLSLRPLLARYVPPESKVLGATNLWWAMPDTDFRSYYMLYYRTNPQTTNNVTTVGGYLDEFGAEYVVLNYVARLFLPSVNPVLNQYLETRGEQIAMLPDKTYGFIEIWKIYR